MTYKYLYQDKENRNCEGEIKARDRADAYTILRKQGIRPYRIIGDDPWNWHPWAIGAGYAVLMIVIVVLSFFLMARWAEPAKAPAMIGEEAVLFREKAEEAVYRAPESYRYAVWMGVNARLREKGIEPIPRPEGLQEEF